MTTMDKQIDALIGISRYYGSDPEFVIAGGGNVSVKNKNTLWIKAIGECLADLDGNGLAAVNRERLGDISRATYSTDRALREQQVMKNLIRALEDPCGKRPSPDAFLHNLIGYRFIVHLHPTIGNALLCARDSETAARELFDRDVLTVPYTDPGYALFKRIEKELITYREIFNRDPRIILLENHGMIVSADTTGEIRTLYDQIIRTIGSRIARKPDLSDLPPDERIYRVLPAVRMMLGDDQPKILRYACNKLIRYFCRSAEQFGRIASPFTPDMTVNCKSGYLYIDPEGTADQLAEQAREEIRRFREYHHYFPRIILLRDLGLIAAGDDFYSAENTLRAYLELMKVSYYTEAFGGPRPLKPEEIPVSEKPQPGNQRSKPVMSPEPKSPVLNRIAIVTGTSQGLGAGIAEGLYKQGAHLVLADIREQDGLEKTEELNQLGGRNRAFFIKTDVTDDQSVQSLIHEAVREFGGVDLLVSNAGILYAGGLDELVPEAFDKMVRVNYTGYYLCARHCSGIMKIQSQYKPGYTADIIQINSKSGLQGSSRNFAYAGAKFGAIGLTQSFALELIPYRIKVNAVCPGNFFEGPLWSDPESGLFIQYLKAGKVKGARTTEDVRKHYEELVPMKRGCRVEDIIKAIIYIVDQEYETGQALPVTGGQVMIR